jgi:AraC-like DNA-binding protein
MEKHQKIIEMYAQTIKRDQGTNRYLVEKNNIQGRIIQCKLAHGIELIFFDYKVNGEGEQSGVHSEHILELFYCLSGSIEMKYGTSKVSLKENHIGIYDWSHSPEKVIYKKGTFKGVSLILDMKQAGASTERYLQGKQNILQEMQQILNSNQKFFLAFGNRDLKSVFLGIIENSFDYDREYLMLKAMELILITGKTMKQSVQQESKDPAYSKEYKILCKAKDYMEVHIGDSITLADIANDISSNTRTINRLFMKHENQTAYQFLKSTRLKQAKELLLTSNYSITEIAMEVGWNNSSKFSIAFKERYGDSPVSYRNANK